MKNIMVALNLNDKAHKIVEKAVQLAKSFKSKIWFVHIASPEPEFVGYEIGPQYIRDSVAGNLRKDHQNIQKYAADMQTHGVVSEGLLIQGPTVPMIMAEAEKLNIDLILIGSSEHGFLYNSIIGSTSNELLKKSKVPLLVVPLN
jgi:nucleotide-binding universal stress UspA family protein